MMEWISNNFWQFLSSLLAGAALTITIQLIFKINIPITFSNIFNGNFLSNNKLFTFIFHKEKPKIEPVIQSTSHTNHNAKTPLNTKQTSICERMLKITEVHNTTPLDITSLYESAVRLQNDGDIGSAAIKYFELFNNIRMRISSVEAVQLMVPKEKIESFQYLLKGLEEMLQKSTDNNTLKKQFSDCEAAILLVFANMPYEPN